MVSQPILELQNVNKSFGHLKANKDISIKVTKGDMIATIKIIPFYVSSNILNKIKNLFLKQTLFIHSFDAKNVALILTHVKKENTKLKRVEDKYK